MSSAAISIIAFAIGYVSLSQEILWYRVLSFATGSRPVVFGHLLGVFLLGLALGAFAATRLARLSERRLATVIWTTLLVASGLAFLAIPVMAWANVSISKDAGVLAAYWCIGITAFLSGVVFPALCHAGLRGGAVGEGLARVYFANIVGATLGPLLTTFVLMDVLELGQLAAVVATAGAVTAVLAAIFLAGSRAERGLATAAGAACVALCFGSQGALFTNVYEKLQYGAEWPEKEPFVVVTESRSGVVTVADDPVAPWIYGHGTYDGRFSIDPVEDHNGITRAYMAAALHREPANVLVIGLSSASWVRVLATHEAVKALTVVEINPAYERAIERFPTHAGVLRDPKMEIVYDDGRRWLRRHPERKFDFILMNTTFHWRSHISSLLSKEFLELCKQHLAPGGVLYYNATGSEDVPYTAATVFEHVTRFSTFVAASDAPFALSEAERRANLLRFVDHGVALLGEPRAEATLQRLSSTPLPNLRNELLASGHLGLITDDNMRTEFIDARRKLYDPKRSLASVLERLKD